MNTKGRVTIPTDMDAVPETLDLLKRWGADAIRDCDGTEFPQELKDTGAKIYATYYTTRKDNAWAKANPDETQQCYIMTPFYTAADGALTIPLMTGISRELMKVNDHDDIARWWEVIDRTTGEPLDAAAWYYDAATESVVIDAPAAYHEYTVSFLAYLIWDPVHMYNSVINDWKDVEHQIPFDVRQPKTHAYTMRRLREYLESHPYVNVVRFTTFFHLFTLVFDELRREKYVDWYGYSASVSPYILDQFEKEVGYKFRPEFIIDQGYYNNQYRVPSKEYKDFQAFQRREVAGLMKEMTDIVHAYGKEAMMFLGDHWIGCEPFMPEFRKSGVDAIVGSVGNGSTLRLISDIPGVKYTEGRFLPYFFPDTFHEGGDPVREAKENWVTARRAILRKPIDRIGYGGYLKLACEFPEFLDYVESVCNEFRELYENIKGTTPYCVKTVAVLNSWGQQRAWGCHMVHHALYQKQNYSYPSEVDTSIRTGWFYHPEEDTDVRTADELLDIYLDAIGANASLLLNIPPDTHGRIAAPDCASLTELGTKIQQIFASNVTEKATITADSAIAQHPITQAVDGMADTYWQAAYGQESDTITLNFPKPQKVSCVVLGEHLPTGQRIESGEIWADGSKVAEFTVVGHKRICRFAPVDVQTLTIKITASRTEPTLRLLEVYQ